MNAVSILMEPEDSAGCCSGFSFPPTAFEKCKIAVSEITGSSNTTSYFNIGFWV